MSSKEKLSFNKLSQIREILGLLDDVPALFPNDLGTLTVTDNTANVDIQKIENIRVQINGIGTGFPLVSFTLDEIHEDLIGITFDTYDEFETIYKDVDDEFVTAIQWLITNNIIQVV